MYTHIGKRDSLDLAGIIMMNKRSHNRLSVAGEPGVLGEWLNASYMDSSQPVANELKALGVTSGHPSDRRPENQWFLYMRVGGEGHLASEQRTIIFHSLPFFSCAGPPLIGWCLPH